jgi:hypothetical protein
MTTMGQGQILLRSSTNKMSLVIERILERTSQIFNEGRDICSLSMFAVKLESWTHRHHL